MKLKPGLGTFYAIWRPGNDSWLCKAPEACIGCCRL